MGYQLGQSACPRCGSSAEVRAVRELFDMMMNRAKQLTFQPMDQFGFGQGPRGNWNQPRGFDWYFGPGDRLGNGIGGAVFGFAGRRFRRKMKKMFGDQVFSTVPADLAQARARAQALFEQQKAEQDAIAARYPELRGCLKDQVVFLDGGTKTVPVSEIRMPVTMAKADDVVARLR